MEDEKIVEEACETTVINDIVGINDSGGPVALTSSDWSAVFFVCKHMKNLRKLHLVGAQFEPGILSGSFRITRTKMRKRAVAW